MNIEVNDKYKFACVWFTNEEKENQQLRDSLIPIITEFKAKKYKFVIFESGNGDLLDLTKDLLRHNKDLVSKNINLLEIFYNITYNVIYNI